MIGSFTVTLLCFFICFFRLSPLIVFRQTSQVLGRFLTIFLKILLLSKKNIIQIEAYIHIVKSIKTGHKILQEYKIFTYEQVKRLYLALSSVKTSKLNCYFFNAFHNPTGALRYVIFKSSIYSCFSFFH